MSPEIQPKSVHAQLIRNVEARSPHEVTARKIQVGGALAGAAVAIAVHILPGGQNVGNAAESKSTPPATAPGAPDASFKPSTDVVVTAPGYPVAPSESPATKPGPEINPGASAMYGSYTEIPDFASEGRIDRVILSFKKAVGEQHPTTSRAIIKVQPVKLVRSTLSQIVDRQRNTPSYVALDPSPERTQAIVAEFTTMLVDNGYDDKVRVQPLDPVEVPATANQAFNGTLNGVTRRMAKITGKRLSDQTVYVMFVKKKLPQRYMEALNSAFTKNKNGKTAVFESYTDYTAAEKHT